MTTLKLSEAKAHLGEYARRASLGEGFIVADRNKPLAKLVPIREDSSGIKPKIGLLDGKLRVPKDFNSSLPAFEADFYAG
jgi:prevent-host-death family protein